MRIRKTHEVWCLLLLPMLIAGCSPEVTPPGSLGSLIIQFSGHDLEARTITPAVLMEVAEYDVEGLGPDAATISGTGLTGDAHQWDALAPGLWTLSVDARNSEGAVIGSATQEAEIVGGETTEVSLTILPLTGPGMLSVSVSWPASTISASILTASLTPEGGAEAAIQFTISGESASYSCSEVAAGYYRLSMRLYDGSSLVWGRSEAVRILTGQTTSAAYVLTASDINGAAKGAFALHVTVDLKNPTQITLMGVQATLPLQTDMAVSAQTGTPQDSWQWFLNGTLMASKVAGTIVIGSALPSGNYWLDVVARRGAMMSSGHAFFHVTDQPLAVAPSVGEVVINEVMIDPAGVADTSGEWLELFNVTSKPLDIEGLVLRTLTQFVRIDKSGDGVVLQPGAYLVLCRNGDASLNGGVTSGYVYGTGISLPNIGGSLSLAEAGTDGMNGTVIDTMQWTAASAGKSYSLKTGFRNAADNDVPASWYWSGSPYSASDMGTPGTVNEQ